MATRASTIQQKIPKRHYKILEDALVGADPNWVALDLLTEHLGDKIEATPLPKNINERYRLGRRGYISAPTAFSNLPCNGGHSRPRPSERVNLALAEHMKEA